jgi:hypothetical protein
VIYQFKPTESGVSWKRIKSRQKRDTPRDTSNKTCNFYRYHYFEALAYFVDGLFPETDQFASSF